MSPLGPVLYIGNVAPHISADPPDWTLDALCQQFPSELFDCDGKGVSPAEAKSICQMCPVAQPCLEDALTIEYGERYVATVRGGLSANQRRKLLNRGQRIVRGDDGLWRHADCERLGVETVTCVCERCWTVHAGECA